ncbi:L-threonylcarbamoyladenylate synthase [Silanimonas sp.]|jgi:L-threonylcarbamoyladenylate synthase|uniref:L-threonylcarbamoyladenylate synthase n=1 Tax=Silanimonas sp. TaxID=1929290 RepID=UPI0037CA2150
MDGKTTRAATLDDALAALRRGEPIGLPTETVYGLAADAHDPAAIRRIYELKGRPSDHPLIVHVADAVTASRWAGDWPDAAEALAEAFWPGPLTLILPRAANVPDEVTGGQDTVGLRVPAHPVAQALLRAFEGGVAAPSANRFGRLSPTTAAHVREEFGDAVPIVLDGGECEIGLESTIVDLSTDTPRILRPGKISRPEIEEVIGPVAEGKDGDSPRASGTLASHYAPRASVEVLARAPLVARFHELAKRGQKVAALLRGQPFKDIDGEVLPSDLAGYGHALYAALRRLDARGFDVLLAELPPHTAAWAAVNDRLKRAAAPRDADGT